MKILPFFSVLLFAACVTIDVSSYSPATGQVALIHGLARSSNSMSAMSNSLHKAGYTVCNISYPSRDFIIEVLARDYILPEIHKCFPDKSKPVHFVAHSLGSILVRQLEKDGGVERFGRVIMLAPPNKGSEVVDKLKGLWLFKFINGPAGGQLGTNSDSVPNTLAPPAFEFGVIAGNRSINIFLSMLIPGEDDGKVSIKNTQLEGMSGFLIINTAHPFIMKNKKVIEQTLYFLKNGKFLLAHN